MGMDFSAVLRCGSSSGAVSVGLSALESELRPPQLRAVVACWLECGFAAFDDWRVPTWTPSKGAAIPLPARPAVLTPDVCLRLPEGFFVTVGRDSIRIYHLLRWLKFLTEPKWQSVMFDALRWFWDAFSATDCVLAHDCHSVSCGLHQGLTFEESLCRAKSEGVGPVASFAELFVETESESDDALKPAKGALAQFVRWPRDKPLPPGWTRPTSWDSKGYWHFAP